MQRRHSFVNKTLKPSKREQQIIDSFGIFEAEEYDRLTAPWIDVLWESIFALVFVFGAAGLIWWLLS